MSKNKQKLWVYDQKVILTFCTTKKLEAIIIIFIIIKISDFRSNLVIADHAHIYQWKSNVYCFSAFYILLV